MKIHQKYLLRCLELGKKGLGNTAPNPMVGCVIVNDKKIIGEGFTSPYGGPHAEVNAINAVVNKTLLAESTLYVSLEPCSHHGKTPPCVDSILKFKIPKVVIGVQDPHEKVAGKGIQKLEEAGCQVVQGVMEQECREHHKRFLTYHEKKRPYVILKWAETQDGFIAPEDQKRQHTPQPFWITNTLSRQRVHQWRSEEQAILVGTETVLKDNPKLSARDWTGKSPVRFVLDKELKIPKDFAVFDGTSKTIVLTSVTDESKYIDEVNYELVYFTKPLAHQICDVLFKRQITSIIVEGGARTLRTFIDEGLWDEARVFKGETYFKTGLIAPKIHGKLISEETIASDTLSVYVQD